MDGIRLSIKKGYSNRDSNDKKILKFDGQNKKQIKIWVKVVKKCIEMYLLEDDNQQISIGSKYLEGPAYDWFIWFDRKTSGLSVNSLVFVLNFKKKFQDIKEHNEMKE